MKALNWIRSFLSERQTSYQLTFKTPQGERVLEDLARFCRAVEPTFHEDPRIHALLEGRREVWLRIVNHLNLAPEDLVRRYSPKAQTYQKEEI